MNSIELKFLLQEQNIKLCSIDPLLKEIHTEFPDGRRITIHAPNTILNLSYTSLIRQIEEMKKPEIVQIKQVVVPQFILNKKKAKLSGADAVFFNKIINEELNKKKKDETKNQHRNRLRRIRHNNQHSNQTNCKILDQCRFYNNCKVKCHRGKTGHMKE